MPNNTLPLVSIAIPTYNRADTYLRGAIDSALGQTYSNIEVIVSNNCSTDNTDEVVKSYNDQKIKYFWHKKNIGANNNFNFCVDQAQGSFLLLLHDDDRIDPDFVEVCINALNGKHDYGLIRTGTRLIDAEDKVIFERKNLAKGLSAKDFFLAWFNNQTTLYLSSTLYNRARLKEIGGFGTKNNLFQDVDAVAKLLVKSGCLNIADVKASFRRHDENMGSSARITEWCEDSLELLDTICNLIPEYSELLRKEGLVFFCRMNYSRVTNLDSSFLTRLVTYLKVSSMFNNCCSPFNYIVNKDIVPKLRAAKNKIKQSFNNSST